MNSFCSSNFINSSMKHVYKLCPKCKTRIKITEYSWKNVVFFRCSHCNAKLKKVFKTWGGISGHTLEEL